MNKSKLSILLYRAAVILGFSSIQINWLFKKSSDSLLYHWRSPRDKIYTIGIMDDCPNKKNK